MDTNSCRYLCKEEIRERAKECGFDVCGFAKAEPVDKLYVEMYNRWLSEGKHGELDYMEKYIDLRSNPTTLLDDAKTVICLAMNYYPQVKRADSEPYFAYYAYGKDYHKVIRKRAAQLAEYISSKTNAQTRICVDTAPIRERYWAQKSGLGFVGKNNQLIIPGKGSFFFLAEIITTLEIEPDRPCTLSCGKCRRCIDACPAGALLENSALDASKCLSCLTIEYRKPFDEIMAKMLGNHLYGCDECQLACPHNNFAASNTIPELQPTEEFLNLGEKELANLTEVDYMRIFSGSAIKRAKYEGIVRNIKAVIRNRKNQK